VICRNCGTEIADKAIVCYRCGTSTTEPLRKPAEIRPKRGRLLPLVGLILLTLAALFLGQAGRTAQWWQGYGFEVWLASVIVLAFALVVVLLRHIRRR
jgi:hypothetical protein